MPSTRPRAQHLDVCTARASSVHTNRAHTSLQLFASVALLRPRPQLSKLPESRRSVTSNEFNISSSAPPLSQASRPCRRDPSRVLAPSHPRQMSTTPAYSPPHPYRSHFTSPPSRIPRLSSTRAEADPSSFNTRSVSQLEGFESGPPPVHPPSPPDTERSPSPVRARRAATGVTPRSARTAPATEERVESTWKGMGMGLEREGGRRGSEGLRMDQLGVGRAPRARLGTALLQPPQSRKRWLVHVLPPEVLPHSPPPSQVSAVDGMTELS